MISLIRFASGRLFDRSSESVRCIDARKRAAKFIERKQWRRLRDLLNSLQDLDDPEEDDGRERSFRNLAEEDELEQSLLHVLCSNGPPLDIVKTLVKHFPSMIDSQDYLQETPLHLAVHYDASVEVIEFLLSQNPGGAGARDHQGKTPLILACEKIGQPSWCLTYNFEGEKCFTELSKVITALALTSPQSTAIEDIYGRTALEHAIWSVAPGDTIRILQKLTTRAVKKIDAAHAYKREQELAFHQMLMGVGSGGSLTTSKSPRSSGSCWPSVAASASA